MTQTREEKLSTQRKSEAARRDRVNAIIGRVAEKVQVDAKDQKNQATVLERYAVTIEHLLEERSKLVKESEWLGIPVDAEHQSEPTFAPGGELDATVPNNVDTIFFAGYNDMGYGPVANVNLDSTPSAGLNNAGTSYSTGFNTGTSPYAGSENMEASPFDITDYRAYISM